MNMAFIGCGYVADHYMKSAAYHPEINLIGAYDIDQDRLCAFSNHYSVHAYDSLAALLADRQVDIAVNLTNPTSHFEVSKQCLLAGKHVYSEKPLGITFDEAKNLVELAHQQNLYLAAAPCSLLGESAQTIWQTLRHEGIGKVYLVYAELDDGMIHRKNYKSWVNELGVPWPYVNEFAMGCTLEHAAYYLTWLTAFFGPAKTVTSFAACLIPDKTTDLPAENSTPDFTVGCIRFESGVIARLTCGIVSERDRSLTIIGDKGTISIRDGWNYRSPVCLEKRNAKQHWLRRRFHHFKLLSDYVKPTVPLVGNPQLVKIKKELMNVMDYSRGIAELATAIVEKRPSRLSANHALHTTELTLALQYPPPMGHYRMKTTFDPIMPMLWANSEKTHSPAA